jgi:hypothetical protein
LKNNEPSQRSALYKRLALCEIHDIPTSIFLHGVVIDSSRNPVGGGGYSDIFHGQYDGAPVAVKKLRMFGEQHGKFHLVVGFVSSLK